MIDEHSNKYARMENSERSTAVIRAAVKDYWLDEDRKFATDDAKAAYLIIRKGQPVSEELAVKYPGIEFTK